MTVGCKNPQIVVATIRTPPLSSLPSTAAAQRVLALLHFAFSYQSESAEFRCTAVCGAEERDMLFVADHCFS